MCSNVILWLIMRMKVICQISLSLISMLQFRQQFVLCNNVISIDRNIVKIPVEVGTKYFKLRRVDCFLIKVDVYFDIICHDIDYILILKN